MVHRRRVIVERAEEHRVVLPQVDDAEARRAEQVFRVEPQRGGALFGRDPLRLKPAVRPFVPGE